MKRIAYYLIPFLSFALVACGGGKDDFEEPGGETPSKPEVKISELSFTTTVQTRALPEVLTDLKNGSKMSRMKLQQKRHPIKK